MAEPSSALGRGQQTAGLDVPSQEHQPDQSSNVISEFVSGVWQGAVTNKVNGVTQLLGADVKAHEVKRSGASQVAHTAGEVTGDLIDFVIMSKFAGKAIGKFAPQIASTGRVGEVIANNPIGRHMAIGGSVGLVNGAILTPTKEGESGWNRVGRGVTDMATFATLSGVATKLAPLAEGTGFVGRLKVNGYSGAAAGVVNSQLDGWTHGRQAGVGETLLNTLAWTGGNIAFGEAFHGLGKAGAKYFPNFNLGETNLAGSMKLNPSDEAAIKEAVERFRSGKVARQESASTAETAATAEQTTTNGGRVQTAEQTTPPTERLAEVRAATEHDGHSHGRDPNFKSVVEEGDAVDLNAPRRIIDPADAKVVKDGAVKGEPIDGTRGEDGLRTMKVAVAPKDAAVEKPPAGEVAETTNTRRVEIEKEPPKDGEVVEARDRVKGSVMLEKGETLSMREMFQRNPEEADKILAEYMTKLEKAFPLEGEIESAAVYKDYLTKKGGTWDMVVLRDKEQQIMGGIQYQIIDVNGKAIGKAAWGEHIWLDEAARNGKNFYTLLGIARENITKNGGEIVFMEFNNPDKMSIEQMLMDEAAGLSAKDREKIWGRTGIHVLVDSNGRVVEYGQPAMSAEDPPVLFLSLGFISTKPLGGTSLPAEDYLKLINAAHRTIPSVNVETDPTVKWIHDSVKATGEDKFTFVPLNALGIAREAGQRAAQEAMQRETAKYIARVMQTGEMKDAIARLVSENKATPEALQALVEQAVLQAALKSAHTGK
jgi:hypothetical protein